MSPIHHIAAVVVSLCGNNFGLANLINIGLINAVSAYCGKIATHGADVWIMGLEGHFILLTCNQCNTRRLDQWLAGNSRAIAVPVTASDTRGYAGCH